MRTTAARWWAPAVTPAAIGLIALGSTSVALAGIDLTTSLRDPAPSAAPVETELTPVTPAGDGADEPIAAGDDDAGTEAVVEDATDDSATPTPSITTPDLGTGAVDDALSEAVDELGEAVTDVTDAVDLPSVGLGGARASNNAGGAQRADVDGGNGNAGGNGNGAKPDEPPGQASKDDGARDQDADQPDAGDDQHPSGRDRSVEPGGSGSQGNAQSDPDDDGRGPDRSNGGVDQDGGSGGVDRDDQDGNNGCGNDDDFEDDNEGWCGRRPRTQEPAPSSSASPSPAKGDPQPGQTDAAAGSAPATEASRSDTPPTAEDRSSTTRARSARRARGEASVAASPAATSEAEASDDARTDAADDGEERVALATSEAGDDTRPRPARKPMSTSTSEGETRLVSARSGPGARLTELLDSNPAGRVVLATASTVSGAALAFTGLDAIVLVLLGAAAIGGGIALLRLSRRDVSRART